MVRNCSLKYYRVHVPIQCKRGDSEPGVTEALWEETRSRQRNITNGTTFKRTISRPGRERRSVWEGQREKAKNKALARETGPKMRGVQREMNKKETAWVQENKEEDEKMQN